VLTAGVSVAVLASSHPQSAVTVLVEVAVTVIITSPGVVLGVDVWLLLSAPVVELPVMG